MSQKNENHKKSQLQYMQRAGNLRSHPFQIRNNFNWDKSINSVEHLLAEDLNKHLLEIIIFLEQAD